MSKCWRSDPLQRPPIRDVRVMLDQLLDTGGYMCLTEEGESAEDKSFCLSGTFETTSFRAMQHSLPYRASKHSAFIKQFGTFEA